MAGTLGRAYPTPDATTAAPSNATQAVLHTVTECNSRLAMVLDRLERVSTRAFGGVAGKSENASPKPVPAGEFGAINEQLQNLERLCASLDLSVTEIDKIV